ncbi:hypothetical protein HIM_05105 [Hirsutella minnesotensis 3608]|uniref:Heterokaryon incompatibility domain-containing protein n=1 Tax=Hirsutella minnesotensis 3608 TaxID=1043627 RepID=A0A0F8A0V9_9HYPO|nr:hypothetical protein HIM_05105 [Hirsutella minnesotensis 3608]
MPRFGLRYLWIHSLYIVQDDDSQKRQEISNMTMIYANASVTLLAVQGVHANSGLRGFRGISEPRHLLQSVHHLDEEIKVVLTDAEAVFYEVGTDNPVWASRGWTFQERFFSRRRLIFDGDSIRWECASAIWREHAVLPSHLDRTRSEVIGCDAIMSPDLPYLSRLGFTLEDYNKREFTYPEDCLNAFAGISLIFSPQLAGGFISGIPTAIFDIALPWRPGNRIHRRIATDSSKVLPSWSWAGWSGRIEFHSTTDTSAMEFIKKMPYESLHVSIGVTRTLRWKSHETVDAPGVPINASILDSRDD